MILLAVIALRSGAATPALIPRGAVPVTVFATPVSRPIAPGFIGLSIEYRSAPAYFGSDPVHPDPVFIALIRKLTPGQSPVLRFGGDTTDWSWWPTAGTAKPGGIRYALGPQWAAATAATARALNARLILGINFEADSPAIAGTESSSLQRLIGRRYIAGFELGNEPEVYGSLGWYEAPSGAGVPGRPSSYNFDAYLPDYARVSRALPVGTPFVGPASGAPAWLTGLHRYLVANPRVRLVTFHRYPLHRCYTARTSPDFPSVPNLLSPVASSGPASSLAAAVAVAHARGIPFRADELNSVSCGGARGVSDTFASALWVLDTLFNMARVGVDGVNIHTFQKAIYEPFALSHTGGVWRARVRPLYYGLLMFARAAPPGSRLLATSLHASPAIRSWATRAPDGTVRVVLLNDSPRTPVTVAVRPPRPTASATVQRLRAPRLGSRSGVTIGGQSFAPATTTGELERTPRSVQATPAQGAFVVRLVPGSATMVTIAARG
ncbi:MAG: glycosyl hydrolase family 79 C-terminal domain-containing protein [Solirubrobacteraceae bacterium]